MKNFKLRYTSLFYEDLISAVKYIENELKNPAAAESLIDKVETAIMKRSYAPLSFQAYPLEHHHDHPYYSINVGNYSVFYVVIDDVMEIRRFIYSKRNISDLLI